MYGQPQVVSSHSEANFLSETFKNMCKLLGIKKNSVNFLLATDARIIRKDSLKLDGKN
jgi:hypothetical protein